jgi:flagella basal body P-ring formation protein FlgA
MAAQKDEPTRKATSHPIVLVAAGKPAKLVVETATLRMTALVTPLEPGVKGQLIRVKNLDTQRVFEAEVVGVGLLRAEFAGE